MTGIMRLLYAAQAKSFEDKLSSGILTFTAIVMFVVLPIGIVLYIRNPQKFTIGFDYGSHFGKVNSKGITAEKLAEQILRYSGITDVTVEKKTTPITRFRRDHNYDTVDSRITLAQDVYGDNTMYAISAAVHECGHALQHKANYMPVRFFNNRRIETAIKLLPCVLLLAFMICLPFGINISWVFILLFMVTFAVVMCPEIVNAPYERDANKRAVKVLEDHALLSNDEIEVIRKMLKKAPHDPFKYGYRSKG